MMEDEVGSRVDSAVAAAPELSMRVEVETDLEGGWDCQERAHGNARLRAEDVREIVRLRREEGLTAYRLSKRFGVAQTTVWAILKGKTWKGVTGSGVPGRLGESTLVLSGRRVIGEWLTRLPVQVRYFFLGMVALANEKNRVVGDVEEVGRVLGMTQEEVRGALEALQLPPTAPAKEAWGAVVLSEDGRYFDVLGRL